MLYTYSVGSDTEGDAEKVVVAALREEESEKIPFLPEISAGAHSQGSSQQLFSHVPDPTDLPDGQRTDKVEHSISARLQLELTVGLVTV